MNYNGLAKIIPFVPRQKVRVGPPWTTTELSELFRVAHVLRQSGMMIETDMGLSDEGDPWFVFYSLQTEDVVAHFARIDGEIVVHGLSAGGVVSGVDLIDVVRRLRPVQAMAQQQSQADRSVVLHPFMMLVAFIAASFLATEESQAAAPVDKSGARVEPSADTAAKVKADWIDRAMTLLYNKAKDRGDTSGPDSGGSRKASVSDSLQHSMALVMLAAAINQAQADVLASDDSVGLDLGADVKGVPETHKLVADVIATPSDLAGTDGLTQIVSSHTASAQPDLHGHDEASAALFGASGPVGWIGGVDTISIAALPVSAPVAALTAPQADMTANPLASSAVIPAQEALSLPEVVPLSPLTATVTLVNTAFVKTVMASSAPSATALTSIDITFEGGSLLFHQNTVDIRLIEVVAGQPQEPTKAEGPNVETGPKPAVEPTFKSFVLTDAQENILVDSGEIRIKNFAFGIDQLVIENPALMAKTPEVLFSAAGDIIINFSETTRVVLLGVFAPSEMVAGVASLQSV